MSTKPGVTTSPRASISSWPRCATSPTSAMTPSRIATSATKGAPPVPSTSVPLRMTSECILFGGRARLLDDLAPLQRLGLDVRREIRGRVDEDGIALPFELFLNGGH